MSYIVYLLCISLYTFGNNINEKKGLHQHIFTFLEVFPIKVSHYPKKWLSKVIHFSMMYILKKEKAVLGRRYHLLVPWELLYGGSVEARTLSEQLVEVATADPLIFDGVVRGIVHADSCIQMQAAEMVEKITRVRPLFLAPYKRLLLQEIAVIKQVEVRQQVALLYGRVFWDEWDLKQVVVLLGEWIEMQSDEQIIKNSIHSLYTLAMQKDWISPTFLQHLKNAREKTELPLYNLEILP